MSTIVVGVDGSRHAVEALRHAIKQARLDGSRLRAVTAWHVPAAAFGGLGAAPTVDPREVFEADARAIQDAAVGAIQDELGDIPLERVIREGRTASVLIDESGRADLLVVGSRGHGGFGGLLLGSVSQECAQHARCPITIVHAKAADS